jgi:hypothetical protein
MGNTQCLQNTTTTNQELVGYGDKCAVEYIWLGGGSEQYFSGFDIRSKTKTMSFVPTSVDDLPVWNYDGLPNGPFTSHLGITYPTLHHVGKDTLVTPDTHHL